MMKTILITGGAGFIGSHLVDELHKHNKVIILDNFSTGRLDNIPFHENIKFYQADLNNDPISWIFNSHEIDLIYHYAATVGVQLTEENPTRVLDDLKGTFSLLEQARTHNVKKILFASSSEVYGDTKEKMIEEGPVNPQTPYQITKLATEHIITEYCREQGIDNTNLRIFNVYGPRQRQDFVITRFIQQALNNENITIHDGGTHTRDFVYVKDHVKLAIKAMETQNTNHTTINIGNGKPTTIKQLAETIKTLTQSKSEITHTKPKNNYIQNRQPDTKLMKTLLQNIPTTTLEDGLQHTIKWIKNDKTNQEVKE